MKIVISIISTIYSSVRIYNNKYTYCFILLLFYSLLLTPICTFILHFINLCYLLFLNTRQETIGPTDQGNPWSVIGPNSPNSHNCIEERRVIHRCVGIKPTYHPYISMYYLLFYDFINCSTLYGLHLFIDRQMFKKKYGKLNI